MKWNLIVLFTVVCLCSCGSKQYAIEGIIGNKALNGKTIFIKERINREWKSIDSTVIENGKFAFKGTVDTAKIAYLSYELPESNKVRQAFILESGKITAAIDTVGFMIIKGTTQNDLLQTYQDAKNAFNKKAEAFYNTKKASVKTPEQELAFSVETEKLNQEEVSIDKKFATEHANTLVGTFAFINSFYGWATADKEVVIALFNGETKKDKRIQEIIADVEVEKKVAVGNKFVDIKLPGLNGDYIALSDLVGKTDYVLIDFWASWCGPCMQFLPDLKAFYNKYNGTQFTVLGVSLDENKEAWTKTVVARQMTWKQVSDLKGWKSEGSKAYAVNSIPNTVLIDKNGKIVGRNLSLPEIEKLLLKKAANK
ncbi:MAG TPA: TlpA disulfide reductase family protein [Paludibacter sp.]|nr:TlpA disulfide reductase family protein [Paludibacter sp.]